MVGREIGGLGADSWRAVRRDTPKGIGRGAAQAGKALIVGGAAALMHALGSDIAALGSMVAAYAPLHEIIQLLSAAPPDPPEPETAPAPADEASEFGEPGAGASEAEDLPSDRQGCNDQTEEILKSAPPRICGSFPRSARNRKCLARHSSSLRGVAEAIDLYTRRSFEARTTTVVKL